MKYMGTRLALIVAGFFAALLSVASVAPAHATDIPVYTESFESCTAPSGEPSYSGYPTAIHADDPILVNLWISELIDCPSWTASGQAWMTTYDSGGAFPDGTHAAWLNEGPEVGTIETDITGLTPLHDYALELDSWVDDQDYKTSLFVEVTNGTDVTYITLKLARGQGVQHLSHDFSAIGDTVHLKFLGSTESPASPLVDNIRIIDVGLTSENTGSGSGGSGSGGSSSSSDLASTGFNAVDGLLIVAGLVGAGAIALIVRRVRR